MMERGLKPPPEGRTLESICITDICQPEGSASARAAEGGARGR
jgi:hypothetical protein